MTTLFGFDRAATSWLADGLAIAVAMSLPWSTSATTILIALWALALLPAMEPVLDLPLLRRMLRTPAAALPVALVLLGAIGMIWAPGPWADRLAGFDSFPKLLAIPLLMVHFLRSPRGHWVLVGFLISATVLLAMSWYVYLTPRLLWRIKDVAVPFKDRITQGTVLTITLFGLLEYAASAWTKARRRNALLAAGLAALFFVNIVFATVSRTAVVAVPVLLVLFGARHLNGRQMLAFLAGLAGLGALLWVASPYLRERISTIPQEIVSYQALRQDTSAGSRIEFWKESVRIIGEAPFAGHGTGAITEAFARLAGTTSNATNPHNQILTVGIQLGVIGVVALIALWVAHIVFFRGAGLVSWVGLVVVVENLVASLFNSQLFDFTTGWIYVFGVGVTAGMVLRTQTPPLYDFSSMIADPKS
jgi:hypothetical protein